MEANQYAGKCGFCEIPSTQTVDKIFLADIDHSHLFCRGQWNRVDKLLHTNRAAQLMAQMWKFWDAHKLSHVW